MGIKHELLDLYDENRVLIRKGQKRTDKLAPGEFVLVVGIWIFNSRNEILLTKRHPDKKYAPNLWENTGGHVMSGESSTAAVVRELQEETGIAVKEDEIHFIGSIKFPPFFGDNYFVRKDISISEIVLQEGETADAKWINYEEFLHMADTGEIAPSVTNHLKPIQGAFEAALKGNNA